MLRLSALALASLAAAAVLACSPRRPPPPPPRPPGPSPEALLQDAIVLRAEGDPAGAREKLEAALALSPRADPVRNELADLLIADGLELDRAAEVLAGSDAATAGPRHHRLAGQLAELRGEWALAAEAYGRALLLGADVELRYDRARVLAGLGQTEEAIEELRALARARPGDGAVALALAERFEEVGRLEEAEAEYRRHAAAAPERALGWSLLARFLARQGREAEAREADARARDRAGSPPERELRPLPPSRR